MHCSLTSANADITMACYAKLDLIAQQKTSSTLAFCTLPDQFATWLQIKEQFSDANNDMLKNVSIVDMLTFFSISLLASENCSSICSQVAN